MEQALEPPSARPAQPPATVAPPPPPETDPEHGLTSALASERLIRYGPNERAETHVSPILKLLSYFWRPIPWMIEVAAVLSVIARHWVNPVGTRIASLRLGCPN